VSPGYGRVLLACALLGAVTAVAGDIPKRRPGLWEMQLATVGSQRPPLSARYCIDAATESLLNNFSASTNKQTCSKNLVYREGPNTIIDSVCTLGESTMTTHAKITHEGDTSFHVQIHTHAAPPLFGHTDSDLTQDSKWLGACPADMQPGDLVSSRGVKMKLRSVADGGA
jgi:hypothetical protein